MIEKKLYKPRSLIFCKDRTNHKERIIYNYLLFRLKQEKQDILKEKNEVEQIGYRYKGHYLKITFKELREHLNLTKKKDIIKMFDNLRQIDVNIQFLNESNLNIGRKDKTKFTAKLIGDIKEYNSEDGFFELTFSPIIVDLVIDTKDYTLLLIKDLIKFKSKYSLIIYEILKSSYVPHFNNNKPLKMSLYDFKSLLNVENYNISNLKQRVLNKAKIEIKKETNYSFEYKFLTGDVGKSFQYIELIFDTKNSIKNESFIENKKVKNLTQKELAFLIKNKLPQNLYIEQLNEEIKELQKALSIQTKKANQAIDELDSNYQENLELPIEDFDNFDYEELDNEVCF
ncbi:replication initiation protein [Arcobacter sp. CECT 8986]|uniref:replication initiation protein n=1 Tax=Arcobacter sp. CECT 8986 TaxID=2044507 RepID=UPI0013E96228|nr:replication initiation protein [Arcobacter sp. CECT 8986]